MDKQTIKYLRSLVKAGIAYRKYALGALTTNDEKVDWTMHHSSKLAYAKEVLKQLK